MRHFMLAMALSLAGGLAVPACAEPGPPVSSSMITEIKVGVFCALQAMDRAPAPGTLSGWIHVPEGQIDFHWPDRQVVPAALGLAFGVKALLRPGAFAGGEMRVYRPGTSAPEVWESAFNDADASIAFFRFDDPSELVTGTWRFEAWSDELQLYSVDFEVVPAGALPEIVDACGATS